MAELPDTSSAAADAVTNAANYPLYVVTAIAGGEMSGCLVGFVTQSSIAPVQFIICVSKANHTYGIAQRSEGLVLHLLGSDQIEVASLFGETTGDLVDKFSAVPWVAGVSGAPRLTECVAWIEGSIIGSFDAGDHEAFLVTVIDGGPGSQPGRLMLEDVSGFEPGHPAEPSPT
jgi:flavin reductase (DIM6/NTAB) family NADH-FMN oxidoreductase RutF